MLITTGIDKFSHPNKLKVMDKDQSIEKVKNLDKAVNGKLDNVLTGLDNGSMFQKISVFLIKWTAYLLVLGGLFVLVYESLGNTGYIERYVTSSFFRGWEKIGAIIGLVLGVVVSLLLLWLVLKVFTRRANELKVVEFEGFMPFLYKNAIPKFIIVVGEFLFLSIAYSGLMFFLATLLGSQVYAPLAGYHETILPVFPLMDYLPNYELSIQGFKGDYDFIVLGLEISFVTLLSSFVVLLAFYMYREIFNYMVRLGLVLVEFLPKFRIPISIK